MFVYCVLIQIVLGRLLMNIQDNTKNPLQKFRIEEDLGLNFGD